MKPLVTVGMPVYNGSKYLREALDSLLGQSFRDFKLIISDNASTDDTPMICAEYAAKDHRIDYFRHESNKGAAFNFNFVFNKCNSKYFKWAAHDDICKASYLEKCVTVLESADDDMILAHTQAKTIDRGSAVIANIETFSIEQQKRSERFDYLIRHIPPCTSVFGLIRSEALRKTDLLGRYYASDVVLLAQLSLMGKFALIEEPLFLRRKHPESSLHLDPTHRGIARWFDTSNNQALIMPALRLLKGLTETVRKADMSLAEKAACCKVLMKYWIPQKKKYLVRDITLPVRYPFNQIIQKSSLIFRGKRA
ncbi:Putative glycosyltransferase EpsE [Anaerohalosphaera lusitana]|uniref:Putative glycosyltransferase EpsE n=1 Tax=Anaerohalosphaera lusitana TaxID=1936003 RepID=A0A1U9NP00_9BACT|nr:glycosyltransferase [Anaerohalosphaera lusitana]AQT69448.1 Putative glycosyltransferase EpsE [Anaerohalosphaera lusitana]